MMWAMEQAVADINQKGGVLGRQVKLLEYDTQDKTDVCAQLAAKAVSDGVAGVAGEAHSGCALAEIPTYNKVGMPAVFPEAYNDTITGGDPTNPALPANPPSIFRIAPSSSYYSDFVYDWIKNGLKAHSLLQIYENSDAGISDAKAFQAAFQGTDLKLSQLTITTGQPSYAAIMARAKLSNPDADVVFFDSGTTGTTYQLMSDGIEAGLVDKAACLGDTSMRVGDAYWHAVPKGFGCAFEFVGLAPSQFNDLAKSLNDRYATKYGGDAPDYVFQAYDAILLLTDAIQRAGTTDHAAVVKALEQTSMVGTVGTYSFPYGSTNPVPAGQPSWMWHQYPDPRLSILEYTTANQPLGQAVTLWPAKAQTTPGQAWVPISR
jgi:ABC-type branched-subunit amino acid transport system substrate-binding protein